MQQRQLRLGDILDDYCPHEHRLTDHAVVAMIGSDIKQVRCGTCDSEHPYKGAKVPTLRKRKSSTAAAYDQVLAAVTRKEIEPPGMLVPSVLAAAASPSADGPVMESAASTEESLPPIVTEDGPAHRPLIRATLPRTEMPVAARPLPEFTIRQATGRHRSFAGHSAPVHPKGRGQGPGPRGAGGMRAAQPQGNHPSRFGSRPAPQHSCARA